MIHHGMPGSGALLSQAAVAAHDLGLGLVGVNRPGYGASSPAQPGFSTAIEDALFAADKCGLRQFAVLGVSGGAPFAAATALAAPDRVTAIGIAAGLGPWRVIEPAEAWDPADASAIDLAESGQLADAQDQLRDEARRQFTPLLELPDDDLAAACLPTRTEGEPAHDAAFRHRWATETREALTSFEGIIYDNLTIGMRWSWQPEEIRQPTWLWYGAADTIVPVPHARWYAQHISNSRLHLRPTDGHGQTVFGYWADMLEALAS